MFGGSGFGSPGVRETKQANASTEVKIPAQQAIAIWVIAMVVYIGVFILLNRLIQSKNDWTLLVCLVHIVGFVYLFWKASRTIDFMPQSGDWIDIGAKVFALTVFVLIVSWYYSNVITVIVVIIMTDHVTVIIAGAVLSAIYAAMYGRQFYARQLTDSLRDSDSKYAINAYNREHGYIDEDKLDWEKERYYNERSPQPTEEVSREIAPPIMVSASPRTKLISAQEKFNLAIMEFLDNLTDGVITTNESSWVGIKLERSGYALTSKIKIGTVNQPLGDHIRDILIGSGMAEWNHPVARNQGWKIKDGMSIEQIKNSIFTGKVGGA